MSRKTVIFKMPTGSKQRQDAPAVEAPAADVAQGEIIAPSEPDRWVQKRELQPVLDLAPQEPAPALFTSYDHLGVSFDLTAERNLSQIVALSIAVPPLLGWFWVANAMNRYQRIFAVQD